MLLDLKTNMVEYKILITTSGLGTRLGELTEHTNKCLVRIDDKPVISHIIESYPKNSKFVISLGYHGLHVKDFLNLAYPDYDFNFINVDNYKGFGSSLGYSILQCKNELNCPFIFHASDTIIKDFTIPSLENNWVIGSTKEDNSQYRTLNISKNNLIKINEKGEIGFDFSYVGICAIKNFNLFFDELEKLIKSNYGDVCDTHVINQMLNNVDFECIKLNGENWFDVGNSSELIKTRKILRSDIDVLDKKDESVFLFKDFVIKFFADEKINENRVKRTFYLNGLVPKIIDYRKNFYKYERVEGNLFSKSITDKKFENFLSWSKKNLWLNNDNHNDNDFKKKCYEFYIEKTKKRISKYVKQYGDECLINGENIPSIYDLLNLLEFKSDWLCDGIPTNFHGDFIIDNVIESNNGYFLIDWRQDFAGDLVYGDLYYDLSKLYHNLTINHDIVNKNLFNSSSDNCYILINSTLNDCKKILESFIKRNGYDLKKVQLLTCIIWLNMSPLHDYPFNKFLFNYGKFNLYKNLIF